MKIILYLFFTLFYLTDLHAQYLGSNGRGDIQLIKNAQDLNGEDVNALYHSGIGRGDVQLLTNARDLNGDNAIVLYKGGSGRGDVFAGTTSGLGDCDAISFWNGNVSDAWENPSNWNCNVLPGINSNVVISSGLLHYPVIHNSTEIKRLEVKTGGSVTVQTGVLLKVNGQ
jgi:hypothetical protein